MAREVTFDFHDDHGAASQPQLDKTQEYLHKPRTTFQLKMASSTKLRHDDSANFRWVIS